MKILLHLLLAIFAISCSDINLDGILNSNSSSPSLSPLSQVDYYTSAGTSWDIETVNGLVLVGKDYGIDIYNSENGVSELTKISSFHLGRAYNISVISNSLIMLHITYSQTSSINGFHFIDISTPNNPQKVGEYIPSAFSYAGKGGVLSNGNVVVPTQKGFDVLDISNISNPTRIANYASSYNLTAINIDGNNVYTGHYVTYNAVGTINIFDLTTSTNTVVAGTFNINGDNPLGLKVSADSSRLFVCDWDQRVFSLNITDLSNISIASNFGSTSCKHLDVADDKLFVTTQYSGTAIYDIQDPSNIQSMSSISSFITNYYRIRELKYHDDQAFIVSESNEFAIVDFSDELALSELYRSDLPIGFTSAAIGENHLYSFRSSSSSSQLSIIDVTNPYRPVDSGKVTLTAAVEDILGVKNNHLIVYTSSDQLRSYDLADPLNPSLSQSQSVAVGYSPDRQAEMHGDYIFGYTNYSSTKYLVIVDVSDPSSGMPVLSTTTGLFTGSLRDTALSNDQNTLYAATGAGLVIVDVTDKTSPTLISTVGSSATRVAVYGDYVFFSPYYSSNVSVYNVSNPVTPLLETTLTASGQVEDIKVAGDKLHILRQVSLQTVNLAGYNGGSFSSSEVQSLLSLQYRLTSKDGAIITLGNIYEAK